MREFPQRARPSGEISAAGVARGREFRGGRGRVCRLLKTLILRLRRGARRDEFAAAGLWDAPAAPPDSWANIT
jgi:hypothetical protein